MRFLVAVVLVFLAISTTPVSADGSVHNIRLGDTTYDGISYVYRISRDASEIYAEDPNADMDIFSEMRWNMFGIWYYAQVGITLDKDLPHYECWRPYFVWHVLDEDSKVDSGFDWGGDGCLYEADDWQHLTIYMIGNQVTMLTYWDNMVLTVAQGFVSATNNNNLGFYANTNDLTKLETYTRGRVWRRENHLWYPHEELQENLCINSESPGMKYWYTTWYSTYKDSVFFFGPEDGTGCVVP